MTVDRHPMNVAVLDDYQGVAMSLADWSKVSDRANITVFFRTKTPSPTAAGTRVKRGDSE
jgi:hypothetical protein